MDEQVASGASGLFRGRGVLVVGHGTADPVGAAETRAVAAGVATLLPDVPVELGFLEVIGPSIGESLTRLAARGCREVVAAPLLLFAAGHAKRDIPSAVAAAAAGLGIAVRQADPFGLDADIVALAARRRRQAGAALPPCAETTLVVIGRGSSDPDAVPQLQSFVAATLETEAVSPPQRLVLGFVAAARPSVPESLAAAADPEAGSVRRILVQPHLLFRGHVEEQVTAAVRSARASWPEIEWLQAPRLGPDALVSRAVVRLAAAACGRESMSRQG
jgi:sirohydrochlorin cobaltochelatase